MKKPINSSYIDIHCHKINIARSIFSLPSLFVSELNMEVELDQPVSIGLHPWNIKLSEVVDNLSVLESLSRNENVLAIGECGLDRNISVLIDKQIEIFKHQINIANEVKKPMIIHNVKSYSDILNILKNDDVKTPWILHGYNANKIISKKLLEYDVYFSFGDSILKNSSRTTEVLSEIPLDRIFFETDDGESIIYEIYEKAAEILEINIEDLKNQIYSNFIKIFTD
jgi:TatD DNase family protein